MQMGVFSVTLNGPVECRPSPAQHKQAQDSDSVAEVVDEGHIVDECVCVTHEHDDRCGPATDKEGRDWGAASDMNHGQEAG